MTEEEKDWVAEGLVTWNKYGGSRHYKTCKVRENQLIDWERCVLCQKATSERLRCPYDSKQPGVESWYDNLATNIQRFHDLGCMPIEVRMEGLLHQHSNLVDSLKSNRARWHKSCRDKFSNLKLERAEKRMVDHSEDEQRESKKRMRRSASATNQSCFFCDEESGKLHRVSTLNVDSKVRESALKIKDTGLLAKLSAGDMPALDAMYHTKCLAMLYKKAANVVQETQDETSEAAQEGIALAELISFIEESRDDSNVSPVFQLADITKMYVTRLKQLDVDVSRRIHSTRLKERILAYCPGLKEYKDGRNVLLAFDEDIGELLKKSAEVSYDSDAMILSKAAKIVRRDLLAMEKSEFCSTFETECQEKSVPASLLSLVEMIMGGPNIEDQSNNVVEIQAALSTSQLIRYNCIVRRRKNSVAAYHAKGRETPLPIYLGLMVHAQTRKRGLVDKLYDLGLSISYNRVLEISTEMGNRVCAQFEEENAVCPTNLRTGLFTTSALDNIDHNPTSTSATGSLHGTGISLFQHPTPDNPGQERRLKPTIAIETAKSISPLPQEYSSVPPVDSWKKEPSFPESKVSVVEFKEQIVDLTGQYDWLNHVKDVLDRNDNNDESQDMSLSWAAFNASRIPENTNRLTDINSLLPLFQDEAHSVPMILHAMNVIHKSVELLNPGQIPVIACDQPLYAIAKKIQWHWPETHGESKYVIMLGGLHIESATLRALGDWLDGSGWTSAIVQANIASAGTAESFLKASHISRTRHAHEVTASSLYVLMYRAYREFAQASPEEDHQLDFWQWEQLKSSESPQFLYWSLTMKFELLVLMFVQSLREGNFNLYQESLKQLAPWHFALDHFHYARWLPIHLHDMVTLKESHPNVESMFQQGHFVVNKTQRVFSGISLDHAHEQNNKLVKGDGGAVGLTENSSQLLRWMVSGPEVARAVATFEDQLDVIKSNQSKGPDIRHHDQVKSVQTTFQRQVQELVQVIESMGNPFKEESKDLLVLDTKEIASEKVISTVKEIENVGMEQFHLFVEERLVTRKKDVMDVIKRNKLALFSNPQKPPSKEKQGIVSLKQNCSLFSQLYVSCQVRQGNLDEFFFHENQAFPPSISHFGDLKLGVKSDLMKCLEKLAPGCQRHPTVDATLIDGAALVNMLKPSKDSKTFTDYVNATYLPYIEVQLLNVQRVDIIWDIYVKNSLKATTRSKRGTGVRQRVEPGVKLPKNWGQFLKVDSNKVELFHYLAEQTILAQYEEKFVLVTKDNLVLSSSTQTMGNISPCTHEEADTRLLLHAADCARQGFRKVMIRTVDTDVVVIAVSVFSQLNLDEVWIAFGVGKNFRYIAVHAIVQALGPQKSSTLHVFHAFTGCDQTSAFLGRGKTTAWETWMAYKEVTTAFASLRCSPTEEDVLSAIPKLERFVVLMYDRTSTCKNVNNARKVLFTQKGRTIENIPPTLDALQLHVKRVAYQAGHCWGQCNISCPEIPLPSEWGWTTSEDHLWKPLWMTLPEASKACRELLRCGCRMEKGCKGHCRCRKVEMPCTALCKCGGECET